MLKGFNVYTEIKECFVFKSFFEHWPCFWIKVGNWGLVLIQKNTLLAFEDGNCAYLKCIVIVVIFPQSKVDIWQLAKDEKIIEPRLTQLRKNCGLYINARGLILHK